MEFSALLEKRYSVRKFASRPVEEEKERSILEAGRIAPTAKNLQPQRLLVVRGKEGRGKLDKAARLYGAPLAVIACYDSRESWKRPFDGMDSGQIDASIVTALMMLEAENQGLGTLWVCFFDPDILRREFNLPEYIVPVNILAIGYPAEDAAPSKLHYSRKRLAETTAFESHSW
ncbi:MAG TPA: nitroreductase [Firmicutes bacterium]|jgi:nitroreductase|nr:nitroreductase [Bacillota bacterium]